MLGITAAALSLLPQRLTQILGGLRRKVADGGGRNPSLMPMVELAWHRLGRLGRRFEALVARLAAGRAARVRRLTERKARIRPDQDANAPRLPRKRAWLLGIVQETAQLAPQVQALLDDPDMVALLANEPKAGRILRPLCHMLGLPAPGTKAADPKPARPAKAPKPSAIAQVWEALARLPATPDPPRPRMPWPGWSSR